MTDRSDPNAPPNAPPAVKVPGNPLPRIGSVISILSDSDSDTTNQDLSSTTDSHILSNLNLPQQSLSQNINQNPASVLSPSPSGPGGTFDPSTSIGCVQPSPGPSGSPFSDQFSPSGSDVALMHLGPGGAVSPVESQLRGQSQGVSQPSPSPTNPIPQHQPALPAPAPAPAPARQQPRTRAQQEKCACPIDMHDPDLDRPVPHIDVLHGVPRNRGGDRNRALVFAVRTDSNVEVLQCQCDSKHSVKVKDRQTEPLSEDEEKQADGFRSLFENKPPAAVDPQILNDPNECARLDLYSKRSNTAPQQMTFFNEYGAPVPFDNRWEGKLAFSCYPNCRAIPFHLSHNAKGSLNANKTPLMFRQLRRTTDIAKLTLTDLFVQDYLENDPESRAVLDDNGGTIFLSAPLYAHGSRKRECFCLVKFDVGCVGAKRKADDTRDLRLDTQGNNDGENDPSGGGDNKRTKTPQSNQSQSLGPSHPNGACSFQYAFGASGADSQQDTEMTAVDASEEKQVDSNAEVWTQVDSILLYDPETVLRLRREIKRPSFSKLGKYDTTKIRDVTSNYKNLYQLVLSGPAKQTEPIVPSRVIHVLDEKTPDDPLCCVELRFELKTKTQNDLCFESAVDSGHVTKVAFQCSSRESLEAPWRKTSVVCPRRSDDATESPYFFLVHEEDIEEFNEAEFISSREWGPGVDLLPLITELVCSPTDERVTATRRLVKDKIISDFDIVTDRVKVIKAIEQNFRPSQSAMSEHHDFDQYASGTSVTVSEKSCPLQPSAVDDRPVSAASLSEKSHNSEALFNPSCSGSVPSAPLARGNSPCPDSTDPQGFSLSTSSVRGKMAGSEPKSPADQSPPLSTSTVSNESDAESTADHSMTSEEAFGLIRQ